MRCHIHKKAAAAAVVCLCVSMPACVCVGVLSWGVGYWWRCGGAADMGPPHAAYPYAAEAERAM